MKPIKKLPIKFALLFSPRFFSKQNINQSFISVLIALLFCFIVNGHIREVYAQSPSPSGQQAADSIEASDSGILTAVDQKLQELKKDIASKAAQLKSDVNKKIVNKALVGEATVITTDTLTIHTKNGSKTIRMNEYTLFENKSKSGSKTRFTKDSLKTDDTLVCLGDIDERGILIAKKNH